MMDWMMDLLYHGRYYGANFVILTHISFQGCNFLYREGMRAKVVEPILTDSLDKEDLVKCKKKKIWEKKSDCFLRWVCQRLDCFFLTKLRWKLGSDGLLLTSYLCNQNFPSLQSSLKLPVPLDFLGLHCEDSLTVTEPTWKLLSHRRANAVK